MFIRNRLKYALTYHEVKMILKQRQVKVDNKVRTDTTYPAGFMDVISIPKTKQHFRLLYDIKGRFQVHAIKEEEAKYKLCKVKKVALTDKAVPVCVTHDGRTVRYPDPLVKINDTIQLDLETGRPIGFIKFDIGAQVMITGGRNTGRVGTLTQRERHLGGFDIVHVKDSMGHSFATRLGNVFIIGSGKGKPLVALPKGKGVKLSISEERDRRLQSKLKAAA